MYLVLVFFYVKFHFPPLHTENDNKNKTIAKYAILCREILSGGQTRFIHPQLLENTRISVRLHFFLLTPILTYTFWVNFRSVVMIKIYKRQRIRILFRDFLFFSQFRCLFSAMETMAAVILILFGVVFFSLLTCVFCYIRARYRNREAFTGAREQSSFSKGTLFHTSPTHQPKQNITFLAHLKRAILI